MYGVLSLLITDLHVDVGGGAGCVLSVLVSDDAVPDSLRGEVMVTVTVMVTVMVMIMVRARMQE